jgi:hypothetical protein
VQFDPVYLLSQKYVDRKHRPLEGTLEQIDDAVLQLCEERLVFLKVSE